MSFIGIITYIQNKCYSKNVDNVDFSSNPFVLNVGNDSYKTHSIIISTGASAKLLGIESESKLMGYGVSACATCDGFFFKEKKVIVIGGGDSAMEEALFLTKFAKKVTVVHRRNKLRASQIMQKRAFENPKIDFIWDSTVDKILGTTTKGVEEVVLENLITNKKINYKCDGVFLAIGHKPNTSIFKNKLELNQNGYIITENNSTLTSVKGVFAAGDVQDFTYRQAVSAAGSGCMAAMDAEKYLETIIEEN
jgi:thioredoxin reductase (NADPH)